MANLDIESLLQEISAQAPCGDNLEDDLAFMSLQEKAKGVPEKQIGERIEPAQPPNWREVRRDLLKLMEKTRDLRLLVEMVRASLSLDGVEGLAESLELLKRALETHWDSLHPQLDPEDYNDPSQRMNILIGLCDGESLLRPLQNAPLVESRAFGRISLRDIHIATGKLPAPPEGEEQASLSTVKAAFAEAAGTDPQILLRIQAALEASLESVNQIEAFVTDQVGTGAAPSLQPIRDKLKESLYAMNEQLALCGLGGEADEPPEALAAPMQAGLPRTAAAQPGGINSRQDVIRALDLICEYYAKSEPSSPVPLLAQRAKRLVTKSFMEIMEDLAPDGLNQIHLIKGHDPDETGQE